MTTRHTSSRVLVEDQPYDDNETFVFHDDAVEDNNPNSLPPPYRDGGNVLTAASSRTSVQHDIGTSSSRTPRLLRDEVASSRTLAPTAGEESQDWDNRGGQRGASRYVLRRF